MLRDVAAIALGRIVRLLVLVLRPGGATAIPGRAMEKVSPKLLSRILGRLPGGVVVVTGSNGKSTTTKMLVAIAREHGLNVFTNSYTANITRGMLSELLREVSWRGMLKRDLAIMEVDEGYAALLAEQLPPRITVALNIMIDQLHRWGEPEAVAKYLKRAVAQTSEAVVLNEHDPQLVTTVAPAANCEVRLIGLVPALAKYVSSLGSVPVFGAPPGSSKLEFTSRTQVASYEDDRATLKLSGDGVLPVTLPDVGVHLAVDAAAAVEAARALLAEKFRGELAVRALSEMSSVFGRGEDVTIRGGRARFLLAKSPGTFQANLDALSEPPKRCLLAIAGDIVEGSPLWMANWQALGKVDIVTGDRCYEMALRLAYEGVEVGAVEPDMRLAIESFLALDADKGTVKTFIMSARAMRFTRRYLGFVSDKTKKKVAS